MKAKRYGIDCGKINCGDCIFMAMVKTNNHEYYSCNSFVEGRTGTKKQITRLFERIKKRTVPKIMEVKT